MVICILKMAHGLTGTELELMLTDQYGYVANRADEVLESPQNVKNRDGMKEIVKESTHAVTEVNTLPGKNIQELDSYLRRPLRRLERITNDLGLLATPMSQIGPIKKFDSRARTYKRIGFNRQGHGERRADIVDGLCGTHLHLDKQRDIPAQHNLLLSLDTAFTFMSSSSYLQGKNTLNCNRVNSYRFKVFDKQPLHGQLPTYITSEKEIHELNKRRHALWLDHLPEEAAEHYTVDNTCWGPVRLRENTIELRNSDANLPSLVIAQAALCKGVNDYVFDRELRVTVAQTPGVYGVSDQEIILSNHDTLRYFEREAITHGLQSEAIHSYLSYLVGLAHDGLAEEERQYLRPLQEMLRTKRNIANLISDYARAIDSSVNGKISPETAAQVVLFMNAAYKRDLADSGETLALLADT